MLEDADATQEVARLVGQERCVELGAHLPPGSPHRYEQPADVPAALALAVAASEPGLFLGDRDQTMRLIVCLPWVARAPAEELYPPADFVRATSRPWRPEDARAILDRLCWLYAYDVPRHAAKAPGRNEPCPCGSGKKYKRCCGAGPPAPAAG
ncbi:MAG: SEC-C domain-containing protein [Deltaproteobacteria bacterium]|nr:SEC-C domain-containing protein [Deltaproteobacteria bacterium]